jgi:chromate reductase
MDTIKIGVLVGSLRKASFCRRIARYVAGLFPANFEARFLEIGSLAMFNQDYDDEGKTPEAWEAFRREIRELDGFLFVIPEYNRSLAPVIKNALDIASRPQGKNVWGGKPGGLISVSPGKLGGFGAYHQFRQAAGFLNILLMQQPEAYVGEAASLLDDQGAVTAPGTQDFLRTWTDAFTRWVFRFYQP